MEEMMGAMFGGFGRGLMGLPFGIRGGGEAWPFHGGSVDASPGYEMPR
jgi:hypothetical protein